MIATLAMCLRPSGVRAVVAESLLLKQQVIVLNRSRERAPERRPGRPSAECWRAPSQTLQDCHAT
jgi:hypothetical protein